MDYAPYQVVCPTHMGCLNCRQKVVVAGVEQGCSPVRPLGEFLHFWEFPCREMLFDVGLRRVLQGCNRHDGRDGLSVCNFIGQIDRSRSHNLIVPSSQVRCSRSLFDALSYSASFVRTGPGMFSISLNLRWLKVVQGNPEWYMSMYPRFAHRKWVL